MPSVGVIKTEAANVTLLRSADKTLIALLILSQLKQCKTAEKTFLPFESSTVVHKVGVDKGAAAAGTGLEASLESIQNVRRKVE